MSSLKTPRKPFYWEKRKRVGNYILEDPLGEGAFGRVRYSRHIPTNEKVAVKIVSKKVLVKSEVARKSLRREGNVLQRLDHPNIIKLYESMETRTCYYLVFELAEGGSFLECLIQKRCLLEDEARLALREIVSAVDHIHTSGFVHRDLRLENLLLNGTGHIKITGFGLCMLQNEAQTPTNRCGSPAYAAPEVFCNRTHGTGVDIWSIGVCMFAMLMGHLPFLPAKTAKIPELHSAVLGGVTLPRFLSKECEDLLTQIFRPLVSERIKMDKILHHKWLVKGFGEMIPRQPPFSKLSPSVVDSQLTKYLSYVCGYSPSSVSQSVHERQCNHISATYHLLLKSIRRGFRIPDISELELSRHDSSDEFLYSTQTQIMQEYIQSILSDQSARTDGISPLHSIPLYKSCVRCLRESRCLLHCPSQVSTTPIGPPTNTKTGGNVPEFVQQYLSERDIKTVDELIRMTTDVESAMQLPEKILAYLCQGFDDGTLTDVPLKDLLSQPDTNQIAKSIPLEVSPQECEDEQSSSTNDENCEKGEKKPDIVPMAQSTEDVNEKTTDLGADETEDTDAKKADEEQIQSTGASNPEELDESDLRNPNTPSSQHNIPKLWFPVDCSPRRKYASEHSTRASYADTMTPFEINSLAGIEQNEDSFGLRDPYAEEIWIAMYPKTIKLQTPIDLTPRRPVLFSSPLSYPKLLTHRQYNTPNQSFNCIRQMVASNNNISTNYNHNILDTILGDRDEQSVDSAESLPEIKPTAVKQANGASNNEPVIKVTVTHKKSFDYFGLDKSLYIKR